ncbi:uncharacterized protein [Pleurodeles waltl]|uniref:uncharacterized protein n=1 Tax=Pleurodeles waltl TaxID=8319 RepID=UPI003709684F
MENTQTYFLVFLLAAAVCLPGSGAFDTEKNHFSSTYDLLCTEFSQEYSYCWCNTWNGWDYCSFKQNSTHDKQRCKSDHTCGKHGKQYSWCYTDNGKWGYCGQVAPKAGPKEQSKIISHMTSHFAPCLNDCGRAMGKDYFWCYTAEGWDYCSPVPQVTTRNQPCHVDFPCSLHGESYYWCYTIGSTWDYCGPIQAAECIYKEADSWRSTAQISELQLMCTEHGDTTTTQVSIVGEPVSAWTTGDPYYQEATVALISQWNNSLMIHKSSPGVLTSEHLHLTMKGMSTHNKEFYYHFQIQIAVPLSESEPIAQVLIPESNEVPERYIRRAFMDSLVLKARIRLSVVQY